MTPGPSAMHAAARIPAGLRTWSIRWLYAVVVLHLLVGLLLPWVAAHPLLDGYHAGIEAAFYGPVVPAAARSHQLWWMALFGATVQAAAVWMGALVWLGARERLPFAWAALGAGLVLWAPQDMAVSLQAGCWAHVWLDTMALVAMLPPLIYLFVHDRRSVRARAGVVHEVTA